MTIKLGTGALLLAALLLFHCPAQGQSPATEAQTYAMGKASFVQAGTASRIDLPSDVAADTPVQRGWSATALASTLIGVIATKNTLTISGISSGEMDAFLRPPQSDGDDSGLFKQARSLYNEATTIRSRSADVRLDPLNLRCQLRVNLNRLLAR